MFETVRRARLQKDCDSAVVRLAQGNPDGLNTIYDRMGRMILSVALQITENRADAEDVLQDVLLKLTDVAKSYTPGTNAVAWILTIAKNLSLNKVKAHSRALPLESFEEVPDDGDEIERLHDVMTLEEALKRLSREDRLILQLKYGPCMTYKEIAQVMEMTDSAVEKRAERAIERLRRDLDSDSPQNSRGRNSGGRDSHRKGELDK